MPKERRDRSASVDRSRASPLLCSSSRSRRSLPKNPSESEENLKEWEEARCPVCMEHPHNAILLMCSSHEKGCRPFMCDTSYRHANCFDQFRKSFSGTNSTDPLQETPSATEHVTSPVITSEEIIPDLQGDRSEDSSSSVSCENREMSKLLCPLCRGLINGWVVVEPARLFMNAKSRSCACETCDFAGTYSDLRKHARLVHPLVRPSEADPVRQRDWRRMERQRDLGDLLSTLRSSIGEERNEDSSLTLDEGSWLTVYLLIRVFRPGSGPRTSGWSGMSRARAQVTVRRPSTRLWGSLEGDSRDGDHDSSDGGSSPPIVHRRARTRPNPRDSRSDDNDSSDGDTFQPRVLRRLRRRTNPTPDDEL